MMILICANISSYKMCKIFLTKTIQQRIFAFITTYQRISKYRRVETEKKKTKANSHTTAAENCVSVSTFYYFNYSIHLHKINVYHNDDDDDDEVVTSTINNSFEYLKNKYAYEFLFFSLLVLQFFFGICVNVLCRRKKKILTINLEP